MTQHTHGAHALTPPASTPIIVRHGLTPVSADPLAPPAMLQAASAWRTTLRRRDAHLRLRYAGLLVAAIATLTAALYAHHTHPPQPETVAVAGRVGR